MKKILGLDLGTNSIGITIKKGELPHLKMFSHRNNPYCKFFYFRRTYNTY